MAAVLIPLGDTPSTANSLAAFSIVAVLDEVSYTIEFQWNNGDTSSGGAGFWYFSVLDETGSVRYSTGTKLTVGWPHGFYTTGRTPPGWIMLVDTSGQDQEAGLLDLGGRCQLYYVPAADLGAA